MHDDLLTQLAQLQSIRVISRTSVLEYRDTNQNIRKIGRELGADAILEGGIQRIDNQIRINVQLIDARSDGHLWAGQYDRELLPANIFDVQTEIARAIASAMQTALTEQDASQLSVLPTENMAVYRAYQFINQAQNLRPSDERLLELKLWIERRPGNIEGMLESIRLARTLDPRNPTWTIRLIRNLIISHQYDKASQEIENSAGAQKSTRFSIAK